MDKKDFLIIIRLLKAYYMDWTFNTGDSFLVDTWYQFLQRLGFERLKNAVHVYIARNDHGPNSPRDLLLIDGELAMKEMINNGESD